LQLQQLGYGHRIGAAAASLSRRHEASIGVGKGTSGKQGCIDGLEFAVIQIIKGQKTQPPLSASASDL